MITKNKSKSIKFLEKAAGRTLTLNALLESLRLSEELSQSDFSKKLKISSSHLCDIEKGRKVISPERAAKFAAILKRSPEQFVKLCLQDMLDNLGLKMKITVSAG